MGVVFISPQNHVLPRAFSLTESCSNNVAEYNALLIGLQLAHEMGVRYLEAYGNSKLIINQVKGEYEVRHEETQRIHSGNDMYGLADQIMSCLLNSKDKS